MGIAALRRLIVLLLCLVPLITLVHVNDVGRWEMNRCAMAAPDELSYLLMAKSIALHGTIATTEVAGRDTFYPPGYPAILAVWGTAFGFSIESMHVCTALLMCAAAGVGYLVVRKVLAGVSGGRGGPGMAVLILALFVCNWHVLDAALFVFSEPAFMVVTFAWLLLGLTWREWYRCWWQTLVMALLAAAAISIRGAGLVCFAVLVLYPLAELARHWRASGTRREMGVRLACVGVVVAVALSYQVAIHYVSPEKSMAVGRQSSNSYSKQLLRGLSDGGSLSIARPKDWVPLVENTGKLVGRHFDDFSESFVPLFRDDYPRSGLYGLIGKVLLAVGLAGWMWRCVGSAECRMQNAGWTGMPGTRFLEWYVGLYVGLYLIWPFSMERFWTPILPVMLGYVVIGVREFGARPREDHVACSGGSSPQSHREMETSQRVVDRNERRLCASFVPLWLGGGRSRGLTLALFSLLLVLYAEEIVVQLPHYQQRLNYVSGALAEGAGRIVRRSADPARTTVCVVGGDEHFIFAWYLPAAMGGEATGPLPVSPTTNARRDENGQLCDERFEDLLARKLGAALADSRQHVFAVSYFAHNDLRGAIGNLQKKEAVALMARFRAERIFQKGIEVEVWEFVAVRPAKEQLLRDGRHR